MGRKYSALHYAQRISSEVVHHPANSRHPWRALARAGWWQVRKRFRQGRPLDVDFEGLSLRCYPDSNSASNVFYFTPRFDFHEMAFIERYLRPGDGFLDIGANIGTYSLFVASVAGPSARIDAFEALPLAARRLRENLRRNRLVNATVHEVAVADAPGTATFADLDVSSGLVGPGRPEGGVEVQVARLDDEIRVEGDTPNFALAKLDVEGAELAALHGATGLLAHADPPVWLVEIIDSQLRKMGASAEAVYDAFASAGFSAATFDATAGVLDFAAASHAAGTNVLFVADSRRAEVEQRLSAWSGPLATVGPDGGWLQHHLPRPARPAPRRP